MSITNILEKIKHFISSPLGTDILTVLIIILVGIGSFGLGRLSKKDPQNGLKIGYKGGELVEANMAHLPVKSATSQAGAFFASNKGTKYYPLGCSAGQNIKKENRIYFETGEEAEASGYTLSASCI